MSGLSELIAPIDDEDVAWACDQMKLAPLDEPRREFLKSLSTLDVSACPGSGKTTLAVAKLAILARKWRHGSRGICVLSHTNVARNEIESRLGATDIGRKLLGYPHFIETIHAFVNRFLATPWLLSSGYRVAAIDNDITSSVRRRHLGGQDFRRLNGFLEKHYRSFDSLRLASANFATPLDSGSFPSGPHTEMHKLAASAMRYAAEQGYFCYDEIFVLGKALLERETTLPEILSHRFPYVLVDEMQDTSEHQSAFLRKIFPRTGGQGCVQRIGDPNQAIFEGGGQPSMEDAFPDADASRCLSIPSSFRFDQSIARLASSLAFRRVEPEGLKGVRKLDSSAPPLAHTIFVFPDDDASGVLDAFGQHLLASSASFGDLPVVAAAIGAVHKAVDDVAPGHNHYPKSVANYWTGYKPAWGKAAPYPGTLAEYLLIARAIVHGGGTVHRSVNNVAYGFSHLGNLMAGVSSLKAYSRQYRHVEDKLSGHPKQRNCFRDVIIRYVFGQEELTAEAWKLLCPELKEVGAALSGGDLDSVAAASFLRWPSTVELHSSHDEVLEGAQPNTYRFTQGGRRVDIRLSSIHLAKGQTHVATLILDTFNRTHFMKSLLPWLIGKNEGGRTCKSEEAALRLYQSYVAMTRPTHLLCLAMRRSTLGGVAVEADNAGKLAERGWHVRHLTSCV